jgi:hypothetical protein
MLRLAFLLLPLAACYEGSGDRYATGQCPVGEVCSPVTPDGLQFIGAKFSDVLFESGPHTTAIGGSQTIELVGANGLDYTADDGGGPAVVVDDAEGGTVQVHGAASGSNYLRILDTDGLLMDRKELAAAALDRIALGPKLWETIPEGRELAFLTGYHRLVIALFAGDDPIVDDRMLLELTGANQVAWDALELELTAGTHTLAVTAGDKPAATLDVVGVDQIDTVQVEADQPATITPNYETQVCFEALAGGRYVADTPWQFDLDHEAVGTSNTLTPNCISFQTTRTSGTIDVSAHTGGRSGTTTLTIVSAVRQQRERPAPPASISSAGDRAAM